ncbi:MAG: hypothetical protein JSV44_05890 [Candidatus Zixiibacteriota bacterium]|nr:MAG: hypothetical protein JSV44_05890 [candidate division Zixibacteria bacterium]
MWKCMFLFMIVACSIAEPVWSQQIATIDPCPLERPSPIAVAVTNDSTDLAEGLRDVLTDEGFNIVFSSPVESHFEARRPDSAQPGDYDRVVVWLERGFHNPSRVVKLYFLYGRYEKVLGREVGIYRIEMDPAAIEDRVGPLKQALIALLNS